MSPSKPASRWPEYLPLANSHRQDAALPHHGVESRWLQMLSSRLLKRYRRVIIGFLVACGILYAFHSDYLSSLYFSDPGSISSIPFPEVQQETPEDGLPPLYETYKAYEDEVSERILQRNGTGRYIYFANHPTGCGWGNVLQEMVYASVLASEANLGYVYDDFTWDADGRNYSDFNGKTIPARIPLSTMISGHLLGLAEEEDSLPSSPPRSISRRVYERICPKSKRVLVKRETAQEYLKETQSPLDVSSGSGLDILHGWLATLNSPKYKAARCIEVEQGSAHVFDIWLHGSIRVHNLWTRLSLSPTLKYWGWSPLVLRAFERNAHLFAPSWGSWPSLFGTPRNQPRAEPTYPPSIAQLKGKGSAEAAEKPEGTASPPAPVDPRLLDNAEPLPILALHIRRGDFLEHCVNLAEWGAEYNGVNTFPELRAHDAFTVPRIASTPEEHKLAAAQASAQGRLVGNETLVASNDERKRVYAIHCFPDVEQIARRVREVVHEYVRFAEQRERTGNAPWRAWSTAVKDGRETAAVGTSTAINDNADLSERRGPTPNELLRKVFIQTNGKREWLAEVKKALMADAERSKTPVDATRAPEEGWAFEWHWEDVVTSRDLEIGWEEKPVAQVLDSYVSQRAEAFVGNGFSSLTSHVVMLRKHKGFNALQTRFW